MVAVKFYLFFIIFGWAIFNIVVAQNMKKQRRPEKLQIEPTNEDSKTLTEANNANGYIQHLAEE